MGSVVKNIPIGSIKVVENHRTNIDKTDLHELMQSIKQHGLKQPIGVAKDNKKKGGYILLFGHRRLIACKKLGFNTIEAMVEESVTDEKLLVLNLTENMQRKDPSFAEFGRIIQKLEEMKLTTNEIAARLGINKVKINQIKRVYDGMPANWRSKVYFMQKGGGDRQGGIPANVATKIVNLKKNHGLSDKAVDGLVKHASEHDLDSLDFDNLGIMMNHGISAEDALKNMNNFKVYTFNLVAAKEEVGHLMTSNGIYSSQEMFRRIIYGEAPALKRPAFLKAENRQVTKKSKNGKVQKLKRIEAMRQALAVKDRLKQLSEEQAMALRVTAHIPSSQWTSSQCEQIEALFNETKSK